MRLREGGELHFHNSGLARSQEPHNTKVECWDLLGPDTCCCGPDQSSNQTIVFFYSFTVPIKSLSLSRVPSTSHPNHSTCTTLGLFLNRLQNATATRFRLSIQVTSGTDFYLLESKLRVGATINPTLASYCSFASRLVHFDFSRSSGTIKSPLSSSISLSATIFRAFCILSLPTRASHPSCLCLIPSAKQLLVRWCPVRFPGSCRNGQRHESYQRSTQSTTTSLGPAELSHMEVSAIRHPHFVSFVS